MTFSGLSYHITDIIHSKYALMAEVENCVPTVSDACRNVQSQLEEYISDCRDERLARSTGGKISALINLFAWTKIDGRRLHIYIGNASGPVDTGYGFEIEEAKTLPGYALEVKAVNDRCQDTDDAWAHKDIFEAVLNVSKQNQNPFDDIRSIWMKLPVEVKRKVKNWVCPICGHRNTLSIGRYFEKSHEQWDVYCYDCDFSGSGRENEYSAIDSFIEKDFMQALNEEIRHNTYLSAAKNEMDEIEKHINNLVAMSKNTKMKVSPSDTQNIRDFLKEQISKFCED